MACSPTRSGSATCPRSTPHSREFGLPVEWSVEDYGRLLRISGGKERMATLLTPAFIEATGLSASPEAQAAEVSRWHQRKTAIYTEMVAQGKLPARPGIRRIVEEAQDAGWTLAVCSTSAEASVRAILDHAVGPERAARFDLVLAGDVVARKKPAPDIYRARPRAIGGIPQVPPSSSRTRATACSPPSAQGFVVS